MAGTTKIRPRRGFALVRPITRVDDKWGDRFELPPSPIQGNPNKGEVVEVSENTQRIKKGDMVVFNVEKVVTIKSEKLMVVNIDDIQAIIQG